MPPSSKISEQLEWCPKAAPQLIPFDATNYAAVRAALESCFGKLPIQLSAKSPGHVDALSGAVAAAGINVRAYRLLLDALKKYGEIEIRESF